ncbi:MAG: hypothetical protein H7Z43_10745 [Clostridia bacterium]|nr:hypothetical protein [Deltaproteobacteria bacterium]
MLVVFGALIPSVALAVDTLVVRAQDGSFAPGIAESWQDEGGTIRFSLNAAADPAAVVQALADSIAGAKIRAENRVVLVSGVPLSRLLEQVANINIGVDPLAQIAAVGPGSGGRSDPEAGGSIRAGKPTLLASLLPHEPTERFEAEVLEVVRGDYPSVALKLKIRRGPKTGSLIKALATDKVVTGLVVFTGDKAPNMAAETNQRNAGAYYTQPKDRVFVHVTQLSNKGAATIDWIERAVKK